MMSECKVQIVDLGPSRVRLCASGHVLTFLPDTNPSQNGLIQPYVSAFATPKGYTASGLGSWCFMSDPTLPSDGIASLSRPGTSKENDERQTFADGQMVSPSLRASTK